MNEVKPFCFVVMPFAPELHYFFLFLQKYLQEKHGMECERADGQILTVPVWEKIRDFIQKADVIVADCTGRNANVFYELGMAHAFDRKVVLITRDPIESVPTDIRHFEFIKYELQDHQGFLAKLDNAFNNIFQERYNNEFALAQEYFGEFSQECPDARLASKDEFIARYRSAENAGQAGEAISPARLLAFAVQNNTEIPVMEKLVSFAPSRPGQPEAARETLGEESTEPTRMPDSGN